MAKMPDIPPGCVKLCQDLLLDTAEALLGCYQSCPSTSDCHSVLGVKNLNETYIPEPVIYLHPITHKLCGTLCWRDHAFTERPCMLKCPKTWCQMYSGLVIKQVTEVPGPSDAATNTKWIAVICILSVLLLALLISVIWKKVCHRYGHNRNHQGFMRFPLYKNQAEPGNVGPPHQNKDNKEKEKDPSEDHFEKAKDDQPSNDQVETDEYTDSGEKLTDRDDSVIGSQGARQNQNENSNFSPTQGGILGEQRFPYIDEMEEDPEIPDNAAMKEPFDLKAHDESKENNSSSAIALRGHNDMHLQLDVLPDGDSPPPTPSLQPPENIANTFVNLEDEDHDHSQKQRTYDKVTGPTSTDALRQLTQSDSVAVEMPDSEQQGLVPSLDDKEDNIDITLLPVDNPNHEDRRKDEYVNDLELDVENIASVIELQNPSDNKIAPDLKTNLAEGTQSSADDRKLNTGEDLKLNLDNSAANLEQHTILPFVELDEDKLLKFTFPIKSKAKTNDSGEMNALKNDNNSSPAIGNLRELTEPNEDTELKVIDDRQKDQAISPEPTESTQSNSSINADRLDDIETVIDENSKQSFCQDMDAEEPVIPLDEQMSLLSDHSSSIISERENTMGQENEAQRSDDEDDPLLRNTEHSQRRTVPIAFVSPQCRPELTRPMEQPQDTSGAFAFAPTGTRRGDLLAGINLSLTENRSSHSSSGSEAQ